MIDIYRTQSMIAAIELMPRKATFLRDRYFKTTPSDIFKTEDVLVEYRDERQNKLAPCVIPGKGGITVGRDGYKTERFTPPYVAPKRPLTIDNLNKKQFGETLFSSTSPQQREASILARDIQELGDMIDAREEYMAAQTLLNNGYKMRHYADEYGGEKYEEFEIRFYDEEKNPAVYTPSEAWSTKNENILKDINAMSQMLTKRGLRGTDLLVSPDVADILINNIYIQKLLDNRRLNLIDVNPTTLPNGATSIGKVNIFGRVIEILTYDMEYADETGKTQAYLPEGTAVLTSPDIGRMLYGSITQMEESDRDFHTYLARRVPHVVSNVENSIRTITEKARPLSIPNYKNSSIRANVLF